MTNRISQVFRYEEVRWYCIIPDSFCAMTSLVLSIAVLFGKKNNNAYHFLWLLGLFGGISTVIYAAFVGQGPTIFYIPTITGLLHHSFSAILVVALLMFKQIDITYKKWYCTLFGFTSYLTVGAFLMHTFNLSDAFHIAEPLLPNTPLTAWVMGPMYAAAYAVILFAIELYKKKRNAIS
jgi:tellurite resistance protein TehA-like permease